MTRSKADRKKEMIRILALAVAGIMTVSVILAAILAQ